MKVKFRKLSFKQKMLKQVAARGYLYRYDVGSKCWLNISKTMIARPKKDNTMGAAITIVP